MSESTSTTTPTMIDLTRRVTTILGDAAHLGLPEPTAISIVAYSWVDVQMQIRNGDGPAMDAWASFIGATVHVMEGEHYGPDFTTVGADATFNGVQMHLYAGGYPVEKLADTAKAGA